MIHTNCYRTNVPIICPSLKHVEECATTRHAGGQWKWCGPDDLCSALEAASKEGLWVVCDALECGYDLLREAVHHVWLRTQWDHHDDFRFYVVDGPMRDITIAAGKREAEMLPFILSRSAVNLRYTNIFDEEFDARELVSAVEDSNLNAVLANNHHVGRLQPHDIIMLFRRAVKEEVFLAIIESPDRETGKVVTVPCIDSIVVARSVEALSALDIAIEKDFRKAAVRLRNCGCKSEEFDFNRLLQPSFQPMLNLLLDPWQQFPFEPVTSAARIALSGRVPILKKLFDCRVDVDFEGADYPLGEACATLDIDMVWVVLDRMGATGVHPYRDYRLARVFLNRLLCTDYSTTPPTIEQGRLTETPVPDIVLEQCYKCCDAIADEEQRVAINVDSLRRARLHPELMTKILSCIDVYQSDEPEELLKFFIEFDPQNEVAGDITRIGMELVGSSGAADVDRRTFAFLAQMLRVGSRALPMTRAAVQLAVQRDYVPLTYRVEGKTLLMVAAEDPLNVGGIALLLELAPLSVKDRFINQIDENQNNILARIIVRVSQSPEPYAASLPAYGDAVEVLRVNGIDTDVQPPNFTASLFTHVARRDIGELCYELLSCRGVEASVILSCPPNLIALMLQRHTRKFGSAGRGGTPPSEPASQPSTELVVPQGEEGEEKTPPLITGNPSANQAADAGTEHLRAVFDARAHPAPTYVAGATVPTVVSELTLPLLTHIASFTATWDMSSLMQSCCTWYYACLCNDAWIGRLPEELVPKTDVCEVGSAYLESSYTVFKRFLPTTEHEPRPKRLEETVSPVQPALEETEAVGEEEEEAGAPGDSEEAPANATTTEEAANDPSEQQQQQQQAAPAEGSSTSTPPPEADATHQQPAADAEAASDAKALQIAFLAKQRMKEKGAEEKQKSEANAAAGSTAETETAAAAPPPSSSEPA